jgi:hypothetical protein
MAVVVNEEVVEGIFKKYPKLAIILRGGVVSLKLTREVLEIDKETMQGVYRDLLVAYAVVGVSSSTFRASGELLMYMRRKEAENVQET